MKLTVTANIFSVLLFLLLTINLGSHQQARAEDVTGSSITTTTSVPETTVSPGILIVSKNESITNEVNKDSAESTITETSADKNEETTTETSDRSTNTSEPEEDENLEDTGDDPWGDVDDDSSSSANIVDQMRAIREKDPNALIIRNVSHLNDTFDHIQHAWGIIDQYYLPEKTTWEKLLGLVTSLNVDVSPECFSSYFSGVSGFRTYAPWAYRCKYHKEFLNCVFN